jgi:hypothetical protein
MEKHKRQMALDHQKLALDQQKHQADPSGGGAAQLLQSLHQHLTSPIEIIRDQTGKAVAARRTPPN